ncbi:MAG: GntR family transcriptional regulator [Cloacibacillus sp.]
MAPKFYTKPLREQVCDYLKKEIGSHRIRPGDTLNLRELSSELGISITPLRDALLQLECEGMVNILPRKGIVLREFYLKDIENYYDMIATLECRALETAVFNLTKEHQKVMREINEQIRECAYTKEFDNGRALNKTFHLLYLSLSENSYIQTLWSNTWSRLFYCPTNIVHSIDWELVCCDQHDKLIDAIEEKNLHHIFSCIKDEHWSFKKQKKYIVRYYDFSVENKTSETSEV